MPNRVEALQSRGMRQHTTSPPANDADIISSTGIPNTPMHRCYRVVRELAQKKPHVKYFVAEPCPQTHTTTTAAARQGSTDNLVFLK
eukprot:7069-Eustigmatos_ZCMA.PRE.1